jgi:hypothetical protein
MEKNEVGGTCCTYWERRCAYWVLVGKPEEKRPPGRLRHKTEDNINTMWTGDADLRVYITTVQDG